MITTYLSFIQKMREDCGHKNIGIEPANLIKSISTSIDASKSFITQASNFNVEFRKKQASIIQMDPLIKYLFSQMAELRKFSRAKKELSYFRNKKLITYNDAQLKEYANWCALKKFYLKIMRKNVQTTIAKSDSLIKLIAKEYPEAINEETVE